MKRPVGITLTVIWMAVLISLLSLLAIGSGRVPAAISVLVAAIGVGRIVLGLWRGELWAYRLFRVLLIVATLVSIALAVVSTKDYRRLYHVGRSVVMGAWAYYLFRPKTRAYFERGETGEDPNRAERGGR